MKALRQELNIDDPYTRLYRRPKPPPSQQTHVKDNVLLVPNYNFQADVLHLPVDAFGYCKLLVIVDLANNTCEFEKMKDSESAAETLRAYERILARGIVQIPRASMTTDGGSGFKGVFHKFLYDHGVDHKVARVGRHNQLANVDNLCRQLGDIFHNIMNQKELQTGKQSKKWVYMIDPLREKLNKIRRIPTPKDITTYQYAFFDPSEPKKKIIKMKGSGLMEDIDAYPTDGIKYKLIKPKYKVGDMVNVLLQEPRSALDKKFMDKRFRMGDTRLTREKHRVLEVLAYAGRPAYRYIIEGFPCASYTEQELKQV